MVKPERKITLSELLDKLLLDINPPDEDVAVRGIDFDSRQVQEGSLFIAVVGGDTDGHLFISEAIEKGAVAVIGEKEISDLSVPYFRVEDSRRTLAHISAAFYNFPARRLKVIGVTGTDGKTTTAHLIYQILKTSGLQVGLITTVNAIVADKVLDTGYHVTTPEAPNIQRLLDKMVNAGLSHVVIEATSHGLDQHRVTAAEFDIGVITNVSHEHLDYHGSYEDYLEAKGKLFDHLFQTTDKRSSFPRLAVLNQKDGSYEFFRSRVDKLNHAEKRDDNLVGIVTYGVADKSDVWAEEISLKEGGIEFTAVSAAGKMPIKSNLVGEFNIYNCLAAIGATAVGINLAPDAVVAGVSGVRKIPGRMEKIDLGQNFYAIVDFAHTPNALKHALQTARQLTKENVIAIFGSAGLRDKEKRRLMAEVSTDLADITILTAEDPRSENLSDILAEMASGAEKGGGVEGHSFWRIPDRGEAIRLGVTRASAGDVVIVCGKGHEQSMCFGMKEYPWDDRIAVKAALAEHLGINGLSMPFLPTQER